MTSLCGSLLPLTAVPTSQDSVKAVLASIPCTAYWDVGCYLTMSHRIFLNVGYELSEKQLRAHFTTFGALSDLYLPKSINGRNKGYGFATFFSEKALSLALSQLKHVINGVKVRVSSVSVCKRGWRCYMSTAPELSDLCFDLFCCIVGYTCWCAPT